MPTQDIRFGVYGPAIQWPYPLHDVLILQRHFLAVLDTSYLVLSGKQRITKADRLQYRILADEPRPGSLLQPFLIFFEPTSAPLIAGAIMLSQFGPKEIWENTKSAFELLKLLFSKREEGKVPQVTRNAVTGDMIFAYDDATVNVTHNHYQIATRSETHFKQIADHLQPGEIEQVEIVDPTGSGVSVGTGEKALFAPGSQMGREVSVQGHVYDLNTQDRKGKVKVMSSADSSLVGNHDFEVFGEQPLMPYIVALARETVSLRCVPEYLTRTTGISLIRRLWCMEITGVDGVPLSGPLFLPPA